MRILSFFITTTHRRFFVKIDFVVVAMLKLYNAISHFSHNVFLPNLSKDNLAVNMLHGNSFIVIAAKMR